MASDYAAIRSDNERRYGTDIGRIGPILLADRYDDRTHFIFELLQNAEDALARRVDWMGSRSVKFELSLTRLRVTHSGRPFDNGDVRGICGIAESTKALTSIGRFGIGFKSVYALTRRPEVHSGDEDFAIESFVWPIQAPPVARGDAETVIVLPLDAGDNEAREEIARGLQRLGPRTLLFLRQIEEIAWEVDGGPSGQYLRSEPEAVGDNVRRITVIGQEHEKPIMEEAWVVFSREAKTDTGAVAGQVEIAFSLAQEKEANRWSVQAIDESPLVVFFPTVLETHLGFLVQGPYRTTPSRDNIPRSDKWNHHLVEETVSLLLEALRWLRERDLLDTAALRCLPLNRAKFGEDTMFASVFETTRDALATESLLPRFGGGYVSASNTKLARTQELRELFGPRHLAALFGHDEEMAWLSGDITQDRTPELRQYLMQELDIGEVTPESALAKLNKSFLESQADEWILRLYEFLNGQSALRRRLDELPLIRLQDGTHVIACSNAQPQAFLPSEIETEFPTVRREVCDSEEARELLESLGLTEPDPVDDVVWNLLPRYRGEEVDVTEADYESDIRRIVKAFATDSKVQRDKLLGALRESSFVMAIDAGDGSKWISKPGAVYLATERLTELFDGVNDVLLVDGDYACLRGEDIRELLEACGATRYLQPVAIDSDFTWEQLRDMRIAAGCEDCSSAWPIEDVTLRGLEECLRVLPQLDSETQQRKARLLWRALGDVEDRRGAGTFSGTYRWSYYYQRSTTFDAAFVRQLNQSAWIPDGAGELQRAEFVEFDTLGWKSNSFLLSKIRFKPSIIDSLANQAGIELGVLELLKERGVTSVAQLRALLEVEDETETSDEPESGDVDDALGRLLGDSPDPTPAASDPSGPEPEGQGDGKPGVGRGRGEARAEATGDGQRRRKSRRGSRGAGKRQGRASGRRPFISYVGAHPNEDEPDPDGLDHKARMALEEKAICLITEAEPALQRTPTHNPGYDLFEEDSERQPARWVEVKAMTGSLRDRPVGLSRTQFECARARGAAYSLYVVEHAGDADDARIVRIDDPARKARTFTFDRGWISVATLRDDGESEPQ